MFEIFDQFFLYRTYVSIWSLVVGRIFILSVVLLDYPNCYVH